MNNINIRITNDGNEQDINDTISQKSCKDG